MSITLNTQLLDVDVDNNDSNNLLELEAFSNPASPDEPFTRWNPGVLMNYILRETRYNNKVYLFMWDCLYSLLRAKKPFLYRKQLHAISLYSPSNLNLFGRFMPIDEVSQNNTKLSVTFSLQISSHFDSTYSTITMLKPPMVMYMTSRVYYWEVEFVDNNTSISYHERYVTYNIMLTDYKKYDVGSPSFITLRYLYCVVNLGIYALLSGRLPTIIHSSNRLTVDKFIDDRIGVDATTLGYMYFVIRDKPVKELVRTEEYQNWIYCQDLMNRQPSLVFSFTATDKVLFNLLCFYTNTAWSNMLLEYVATQTRMARNIRWSLLFVLTLLKDLSFETWEKADPERPLYVRPSNIHEAAQDFIVDEDDSEIELDENIVFEDHRRLYTRLDYYPQEKQAFSVADIASSNIDSSSLHDPKNWYKILMVLGLFVDLDRSCVVWLLESEHGNKQNEKLVYLYRQLVYYFAVNDMFSELQGLASRISNSFVKSYIPRRVASLSPLSTKLIKWSDLLAVKGV